MEGRFFTFPNLSGKTFDELIPLEEFENLTLEEGILGALGMLIGIISIILGMRLYRLSFFFSSVYFVYILTYPTFLDLVPKIPFLEGESSSSSSSLTSNDHVAFYMALSCSILAGVLFCLFWKVGLFVVGCVCGFSLSSFFLGFLSHTVLAVSPWNFVFSAACSVLFGCLLLIFKKPLLIVATSIIGGYFTIYGLDVLLAGRTGFAETFDGLSRGEGIEEEEGKFSKELWGMIAGSLGLTLLGIFFQFFVSAKNSFLPTGKSSRKKGKSSKVDDEEGLLSELEMRLRSRSSN